MSIYSRRAAYSEAEYQANLVRQELLVMIEALKKRLDEVEKDRREPAGRF